MSPVSIPIYTPFGFFCLPVSTSNRTTQTGLSFPPVWPKETDIFVSLPLSLLCFKAGVILKFRSCNFVSRLENVLLFVCGISSRVSESTRMILCFWCICMQIRVFAHSCVYRSMCVLVEARGQPQVLLARQHLSCFFYLLILFFYTETVLIIGPRLSK